MDRVELRANKLLHATRETARVKGGVEAVEKVGDQFRNVAHFDSNK